MSEHLGVKGKVEYYHDSFGDKDEITYCQRCKDTCEKATFEIHQGILGYWLKFVCGHCKKTIWVAGLIDRSDFEGYGDTKFSANDFMKRLEGKLIRKISDDAICAICGKKTNYYDASCVSLSDKKNSYYCSKACYSKRKDVLEGKT